MRPFCRLLVLSTLFVSTLFVGTEQQNLLTKYKNHKPGITLNMHTHRRHNMMITMISTSTATDVIPKKIPRTIAAAG